MNRTAVTGASCSEKVTKQKPLVVDHSLTFTKYTMATTTTTYGEDEEKHKKADWKVVERRSDHARVKKQRIG